MHPQLWLILILLALGFALVGLAAVWLARRWSALNPRWWLLGAGIIVELALWLLFYATFVEPNQLAVRRVEIVSADWRGAPITLAAISDTHVGGPHVSAARMERVVRRINALQPDLVVLLGDYVAGHLPEAERAPAEQQEILGGIATFASLEAPLGVVGVIGNHDSWFGRGAVSRAMEDAGVATLWNRNVVISRPGGDIVIAGIADDWTGDPDFTAALDGAEGEDTIVLSHSPDPFADLPEGPALMLAAHSHCGQVSIPGFGRPILPVTHRDWACGRVTRGEQTLYVTGGIGTSVLPVRFLNPPEIVLITVRGARA